ncbi:hypothetical protein [Bradyrhizobium sp. S3.2.6]|uniref:hypothetical protein n=1 Tax=Bradyrhizobium sp. S3.2.6 TaxID=3156428 RepID=UPI0033968BF2
MWHADRCGKGEPQPRFLDLPAEAFQRRFRILQLPPEGRAELPAGPPEEVEGFAAETIELGRQRHHVEPVGFIPRHGEAQQR